MKSLAMFCVVAGATLSALPAKSQDVLIRGATVYTVTEQGALDNADVLVRGGKIAAVDAGLAAPAGVAIVEAEGRPLTPGLFGGLSNIGLMEVIAEGVDASLDFGAPAWRQQWRPEFDVTLAYDPRSTVVPVTRIEGVTWTMLAPWSGGSIIAGQGAAVTLDGRYDAVLDGSRSLFVSWNGGERAGDSRAGLYMLFDQAIREVRNPREAAGDRALLYPAGREVLDAYLDGGRVVFEVQRAADIRRLIAYARRNGMRPVLTGADEAWAAAGELARADVPVILNPLDNLPSDFDRIGARLDNALKLHQAGVRIAFSSGEVHNARRIRQVAGNAVAHGLPWEVALAAITATPAEIFGLAEKRGRIAVGQVADLVLWSADPLEVTTLAQQVWIAGRPVDMRSRQTELTDRYSKRSSMQ